MTIQNLSNTELLQKTDSLVQEERELLAQILHCFCEIERRRLFSDHKKGSMYEFIRDRYQYSNDQVYRRLDAMRLLRELPEIEEKIISGDLNLTHLNLAHAHFRNERKLAKPLAREAKLEVLEQISNQSVDQTKRIVLSLSSAAEPESICRDQIEPLPGDRVVMTFAAPADIVEKIQTLRGYMAHTHPDLKLGDLFAKLCDVGLTELAPSKAPSTFALTRKAGAAAGTGTGTGVGVCAGAGAVAAAAVNVVGAKAPEVLAAAATTPATKPQPLSKSARRSRVFAKAQNACQSCGSTYALELDHILPRAKGGSDDEANLRVLCRRCNQHQALRHFGQAKMAPYLWQTL